MQVRDSVVVVTGGGSGIGAAMAARFVADGARSVVVADIDGAAAATVADALDARASSCTLDVTDEVALGGLVADVLDEYGRIDLFCSNAGIAPGMRSAGGDPLNESIDTWQLALDVNLMAHVYAARAVVPAMLERGRGYLLNTVSAAGLLTSPGDAIYTASKHAALGFAEFLSIQYGGRGIGVSVLCPQGVATPLLLEPLSAGNAAAAAVVAAGNVLTPDFVADCVVDGLADERFLILPHPEVARYYANKAADPDRWLAAMRRFV